MNYSLWLEGIALLFGAVYFYRWLQKKQKDKVGILSDALFKLFLGLVFIYDSNSNSFSSDWVHLLFGSYFIISGFIKIMKFIRGGNENGRF